MTEIKIKNLKELKVVADRYRKSKKSIIFTNGCFDILHAGHVEYLEAAKKMGDILMVALNSDISVRKIKKAGRPVIGQDDRARVVAGLQAVDYVVMFDEETPITVINTIMPNILVKGGDWNKNDIVGADVVKNNGGDVRTIPFVEGKSTTGIIDKIRKELL